MDDDLNNDKHNMYPARIVERDGALFIHMDDHDAYYGWKFTERAENQLYEILGQRACRRGEQLLGRSIS